MSLRPVRPFGASTGGQCSIKTLLRFGCGKPARDLHEVPNARANKDARALAMLGRYGYQRSGVTGARNAVDSAAADALELGRHDFLSLDNRIVTVELHEEV